MDLIDLVKEQGIVDIILDYRNQMECNERFEPVLKELKMMTEIEDSNDFLFDGWQVKAQLSIIEYKKNNKTKMGVINNTWKMIKFLFGFTYQFVNDDVLS